MRTTVAILGGLLIMSAAQAIEVIPSLELRINRLNGVTRIVTTGTAATTLCRLSSYFHRVCLKKVRFL